MTYLFMGDIIFYVDTLRANQPFMTTWRWVSHELNRGIVFVDEEGNTRLFAFAENHVGGDTPPFSVFEILK